MVTLSSRQRLSFFFFQEGKKNNKHGCEINGARFFFSTACAALELFAISAAAATSCRRAELPLRATAASSGDMISPRSEAAHTLRCVLTARTALDAAVTALPWHPGDGGDGVAAGLHAKRKRGRSEPACVRAFNQLGSEESADNNPADCSHGAPLGDKRPSQVANQISRPRQPMTD